MRPPSGSGPGSGSGSGRPPHNTRTPPTPDERPAARCGEPPSADLLRAVAQFNAREYFECHETLEIIWRDEPGLVRVLYKGVLQVGVGCYHLLRGNYRGAILKLTSGAAYLEPYAPRCMGLDVAALIADAHGLRAAIEALGPERLGEVNLRLLPTVHLLGAADEQADEQAGG